jgi:hypothetical protein
MYHPGTKSRLPSIILYAVLAAVIVIPMHAMTLQYGFDWDDYHFVRPLSAAEIRSTFTGPWDPSGIEVRFYRPLTAVFYAVRFHFFGLNAEAYHALSLVMFWLAAALFGLLARALLGSNAGGALAIATFAVHPAMPYAAVAWVTNQMHLLQLLVVLSALLWWFFVRRRGAAWWMPLVLFELAALMVKEDGVMLVPVILMLHWLRRATAERDLPHPPWAFIALAAAAGAALLYYRAQVLDGIGGYRFPSTDQATSNYSRGFLSVFRPLPGRRPWEPESSWFVTILPIAALVCWRRCSPNVRFTLLAGIAIGALFNLPFVFIVKAQQMHLVAMGGALLITAAVLGVAQAVPGRALVVAVALVAGAGLTSMAMVARDITRDFEPFGKIILATDDLVTGWAAVPVELRHYLAEKKQPGASARLSSNPAEALNVVAFGLHSQETDPAGRRFRWMSGPTTEVYVNARLRTINIPLRHAVEAVREPVTAVIEVDGRVLDRITLSGAQWRQSSLSLRAADVQWWRRMHRVVIRLDRTWVPAHVIPGSGDTRTLGLQVGDLSVR